MSDKLARAESPEAQSATTILATANGSVVTPSICPTKQAEAIAQQECCPNQLYDLLKGLSSSLAWPLVVLLIFLFLKDRISKIVDYVIELIPSTTKFSAGGDGFVWERSIESIKAEAEKLDSSAVNFSSDVARDPHYQLAKIYPRGAILEAWNSVQATMFRFVSHNLTIDTDGLEKRLPEEMLRMQVITKEQYTRLRELVVARNQAVHGLITPTTEDAIAYLKVASEINGVIKALDLGK